MSTLIVENISDGSGTNIDVSGIATSVSGATAWCRFDARNGGSIGASYNVSSVTDINTGRTIVTFTTEMDNTDYVALGNASSGTDTSTDTWINPYDFDSSFCSYGVYNSSGNYVDRSFVCVAFFGGKS